MNLLRPGMGTENSLKLISALIQMKRPRTVLEIGAGDSSVAIVEALVSAMQEHCADKELINKKEWSERGELVIPRAASTPYNPIFVTIDNFSAEGCSADEAWKSIARYEKSGLDIRKVKADFFAVSEPFLSDLQGIDFLWIDAGTLTDDVRFINRLWPHISPGGILALHEPYFTTSIQNEQTNRLAMVRTPLWEAIVKNVGEGVDILSVPELHKYRQSGIGILRKHEAWEQPRSSSFQDEMICISEPPARFSKTGIRNNKLELLREVSKKTRTLKAKEVRKVLFAIGLGRNNIKAIVESVALSERDVASICKKLLNAGFIKYSEGQFSERNEFWTELPDDSNQDEAELSDSKIESSEILDLIVSHLEPQRAYSEREISDYCQIFTDDFARLRRKLVDTQRLNREANTYCVNLSRRATL